ncbi:hypothetical protein Vadar_010605 [Vaccinium darrowii]|uniref:Uncharacterized protein n=1 Tax=Vaccinium darrowii TaxID=229202 RepID=A0ACB7ZBP1_9ERIC|nr:hypothetical protein Vadar_010605 [Vaccinium darrowii]
MGGSGLNGIVRVSRGINAATPVRDTVGHRFARSMRRRRSGADNGEILSSSWEERRSRTLSMKTQFIHENPVYQLKAHG